jgi:hypothetical protein
VNVPAAGKTFAEVVASPAKEKGTPSTPVAVNAAKPAAAGLKALTASVANPSTRAKRTVEASRVSQRAALLKKKRAAAAADAAAGTAVDEMAAPEVLRGTEGETDLDLSIVTSLVSSPPPPPPPLDLTNGQQCDCSFDCEDDFHDELWEDGVRLNTLDPPWQRIFYECPGYCRFCKEPMDEREDDDIGECLKCEQLSTFECVKKFAPRWRYPTAEYCSK